MSKPTPIANDLEEPVFTEPWQAQAFALALALQQEGLIAPGEWTEALAAAIKRAQAKGDPDLGDSYYEHWLCALEELVRLKEISDSEEMAQRVEAWRRSYLATPHGSPVELIADDS
ncbi:MAG: nitrile hydratase accessory protein [Proteobacteria bacterium]|nr:nitrile hydratase accessory protein [Pseudomonadota bacterium]MDA0928766.1 nitrile hydratase accessory protein [Pseudomonadota bacterium]